jgi:hypothetical protein
MINAIIICIIKIIISNIFLGRIHEQNKMNKNFVKLIWNNIVTWLGYFEIQVAVGWD